MSMGVYLKNAKMVMFSAGHEEKGTYGGRRISMSE